MISYKELRHLRMLAAIREGYIPEDQLKYLGKTDGEHTYLTVSYTHLRAHET